MKNDKNLKIQILTKYFSLESYGIKFYFILLEKVEED